MTQTIPFSSSLHIAMPIPGKLKAFYVDDGTIYAAQDAFQAAVLYEQDTGLPCEEPEFPTELTSSELDAPIPELDDDERITGGSTSVRAWLTEARQPGLIACNG